ncbi:MAG: N-acetyltransferase [Thermoplasmatales archaeon]|nr:MAG: N-acetyltransferase [Thermoplasmatales archaeon]
MKKQSLVKIRQATLEDLETITEIYNEAILKTVATFDTQLKTLEEQKAWFMDHGPKNPIFIAEKDGIIVGWAALSEWSDRCAYSDTAELSLYVLEENQGQGIGRKLLEAIIHEGEKAGLHTVIARITEGNEASFHLHESVGFSHIGIMKEVGLKFGKRLDVYLMQKIYNP